jgi:hypothetical protein
LEFSANIGKWQLRGIDLVKFNEAGEMVEFEVMVRTLKALQALAEEIEPDRPAPAQLKAAAALHTDFGCRGLIALSCACAGGLCADRLTVEAFGRFS